MKKIKKYIEDDFNKSYNCDLQAEDIIKNTDFFKNSKEEKLIYRPTKLLVKCCTIIIACLIFATMVFGIVCKVSNDKQSGYLNKYLLTEEEIEYYEGQCDKFFEEPIGLLKITNCYTMIIYAGTKGSNSELNYYFYKIIYKDKGEINLTIKIDNKTSYITDDRYRGILTIIGANQSQIIRMTVTINGIHKSYVLEF